MRRIEEIVGRLPQTQRVDVAAWGGEPTFRVGGKTFVFADPEFTRIGVKLSREEAEAVCATDDQVEPTGHGLGRSGWVSVTLGPRPSAARWRELEEWIRTSYSLVAPKKLARALEAN